MIPLRDVGLIALIAAACSLGVAALGWLALRLVRRRSVTLSLGVVVAVSMSAVIASAVGTAAAMFLSGHDLVVLLGVVAVSGPVGFGVAMLLGHRLMQGSRELGAAMEILGEAPYSRSTRPLGAELATLDRKLAEADARLHASMQRERALEASRRELVAWISHDLRTPLAGIRAMTEALADGVVSDPMTTRRYHEGIHRETARLTGMVDDLFELSRINAGALQLTMHLVTLAEVMSDVVASTAPVAAAKGVRLVADPPELTLAVDASVPELSRVLRNVLSNAIRHTPADGTVSVQAARRGDWVVVEVADACGGIPAEDLPRLFDIAFRGSAARPADDDGGAGLGLVIARGLVQAHSGDIDIANAGAGCRVQVRLPYPRSLAGAGA